MCVFTLRKVTYTYDLQFIEGSPVAVHSVTVRYDTDEYAPDALISALVNDLTDVAAPSEPVWNPTVWYRCEHCAYHDSSEVDVSTWHPDGMPDDLSQKLFDQFAV